MRDTIPVDQPQVGFSLRDEGEKEGAFKGAFFRVPATGPTRPRVLSSEEYLRRRIVRVLDAIAYPDEQGGALVDQHASEGELASRVIPVRLDWVRRHAEVLDGLMEELRSIWTASGRMDEGALRDEER